MQEEILTIAKNKIDMSALKAQKFPPRPCECITSILTCEEVNTKMPLGIYLIFNAIDFHIWSSLKDLKAVIGRPRQS